MVSVSRDFAHSRFLFLGGSCLLLCHCPIVHETKKTMRTKLIIVPNHEILLSFAKCRSSRDCFLLFALFFFDCFFLYDKEKIESPSFSSF